MPGSGYRGNSTGKYKVRLVEEYVTLYRVMEGECIIDHIFHGKQDYQGCFARWIRENSSEKTEGLP